MQLSVSELLKKAAKKSKVAERAEYLQKHDNPTMRKILKYTFSPKITFNMMPEGAPPYEPTDGIDLENVLYAETRRLYLFTDGGNPDLKQIRKESLYIELLESVDPEDAKLLVYMKDKKLGDEYKGLTKSVVEKAFPGMI